MNKTGYFYSKFRDLNPGYSRDTFKAAEDVVGKMLNPPSARESTNPLEHPGVLLGKVQSGKTRTFVTLLTLAFDNGFDLAFILTKNSKPLLEQTRQRLQEDLKQFEQDGVLAVYDIMSSHERYSAAEFSQKLIFVCKKEDDNMNRLKKRIEDHQDILRDKKILFIDDEGDTSTIGFRRDLGQVAANIVPSQISEIRRLLNRYSYLSVTATPYSLYLQPTDVVVTNVPSFKPVRPSYTVLAPVGAGYVGGEVFFDENHHDERISQLRPHLCVRVDLQEIERLKRYDGRSFNRQEFLQNTNYQGFRDSLVNFLTGGAAIRLLRKKEGIPDGKLRYAFVVHTETGKSAHSWQIELTSKYIEAFKAAAAADLPFFRQLCEASYQGFSKTLEIDQLPIQPFEKVYEEVKRALRADDITVTKVNSEKELVDLLDTTGQLRLRVAYNIFVGGQVMDRGVTIANLIGFFYGRRPQKSQQDTVIQHQRMYGYRRGELAVTRLYTTAGIFQSMQKMDDFDRSLREEVRKRIEGGGDGSINFIRRSRDGSVIPCSPNKILASKTKVLRPPINILPIGFQSGFKTKIADIITKLDQEISELCGFDKPTPTLINLDAGIQLLSKISQTLCDGDEDEAEPFDWEMAKGILTHLSLQAPLATRGKIWVWAAFNRQSARFADRSGRSHATFIETPFSKTENQIYQKYIHDNPILFLLRQKGQETNEKDEKEWRGTPFYWPVIRVQRNAPTSVYAMETLEDTDAA